MENLPPLVKMLGIRAQDVAAAAHLHPSTISRVLQGHQKLSAPTLLRLEAAIVALLEQDAA